MRGNTEVRWGVFLLEVFIFEGICRQSCHFSLTPVEPCLFLSVLLCNFFLKMKKYHRFIGTGSRLLAVSLLCVCWRLSSVLETGFSVNISLFLSAKVTSYLARALQSQQSARSLTDTQKLPKTPFALAKTALTKQKKRSKITKLCRFSEVHQTN